jgi:hypothetical protein
VSGLMGAASRLQTLSLEVVLLKGGRSAGLPRGGGAGRHVDQAATVVADTTAPRRSTSGRKVAASKPGPTSRRGSGWPSTEPVALFRKKVEIPGDTENGTYRFRLGGAVWGGGSAASRIQFAVSGRSWSEERERDDGDAVGPLDNQIDFSFDSEGSQVPNASLGCLGQRHRQRLVSPHPKRA